jgi:hypothetical protein
MMLKVTIEQTGDPRAQERLISHWKAVLKAVREMGWRVEAVDHDKHEAVVVIPKELADWFIVFEDLFGMRISQVLEGGWPKSSSSTGG